MFDLILYLAFYIAVLAGLFLGLPVLIGRLSFKRLKKSRDEESASFSASMIGVATAILVYAITWQVMAWYFTTSKIERTLSKSEIGSLHSESMFFSSSYTYIADEDKKKHCIAYIGNPLLMGEVMFDACGG